jgi:alpha/beta superfamily hydrolase
MTAEFRERLVAFGEENRLSGVLTSPTAGPGSGVSCVIHNSGVVPRAGVARLHVRLARRLAARGVRTLRFDLSGLGDSERASAAARGAEGATNDLLAASDFLRDTEGSRGECFIGLCSAAYDGLAVAATSDRAVGLVAIDLIGEFRTTRHVVTHYARRAGRIESWVNAVTAPTRAAKALQRRLSVPKSTGAPDSWLGVRPVLPRETMRARLDGLLSRGAPVLFVFSGGLEDNYNYEGQLGDALPELRASPLVEDVFMPHARHVFDDRQHQLDLCTTITDWVVRRFGDRA